MASDDDSIVSSGDEILNIVVPFSQDSVEGKKSESDDDTSSASPSKKRKPEDDYSVDVGNLKNDNNDDAASDDKKNKAIALANATTAFKIQYNDQKLGATNKLFWNVRRMKKNATLYPVRVVPREEIVGLCLKEWNTETERPVQYIQYPHKQIKRDLGLYDVVSVKSLTPYHGGDGPTNSWCSKRIQQYSKQLKRTLKGLTEIDLLAEEAFLKLVLEQSLKEEESERERSLLAEATAAVSAVSEEKEDEQVEKEASSDSDDDDGIRRRNVRLCRKDDGLKHECLRVGDIIEYQHPIQNCRRQEEVKFINPKGDQIIITSDIFTMLPSDYQVKRVKRMQRGKLLDHHDGSFRAINSYILKKEGVSQRYSFCVYFMHYLSC